MCPLMRPDISLYHDNNNILIVFKLNSVQFWMANLYLIIIPNKAVTKINMIVILESFTNMLLIVQPM